MLPRSLLPPLFLLILGFESIAGEITDKYPRSGVEMQAIQVSSSTWYVQGANGIATDNEGFISNAGFVVTSEGVVVFDALGTPSLGLRLLEEIRKVTDKPVVKVVVSHYHADHIYGLQIFEELGAEIIAPAGVDEYIQSDAARNRLEERRFSLEPFVNDDTRIVIPDTLLQESTQFRLGDLTFTLNLVGSAHSEADLTMYIEEERVLYSGDIIFRSRIPFIGNADTKHWLQTLQRMETDKLHALIPGHGSPHSNPNKTIQGTREYLSFIREQMRESANEMLSFDEAYEEVDWSRFENIPAFREANKRNAYSVFLSMEQELISE